MDPDPSVMVGSGSGVALSDLDPSVMVISDSSVMVGCGSDNHGLILILVIWSEQDPGVMVGSRSGVMVIGSCFLEVRIRIPVNSPGARSGNSCRSDPGQLYPEYFLLVYLILYSCILCLSKYIN